MIKTLHRETFDEIWVNKTRYQFFELKQWRWHWPKCFKAEGEIIWVLPTMSVMWFRAKGASDYKQN